MKKGFTRTGKTDLTDDELVLFDAIFDCRCPVNSLKKKGFMDRFNFSYTHNLNNKELAESLESLHTRKLIKISKGLRFKKPTDFVSLTAKGGKLWEKEREPIWEKFVVNLIGSNLNGNYYKQDIEYSCPSLDTLRKCIGIDQKLDLRKKEICSEIKYTSKVRTYFIYWKRFPVIYSASWKEIITVEDAELWHDTDWDSFYNKLDWWRNIPELNLLKKNYEQ